MTVNTTVEPRRLLFVLQDGGGSAPPEIDVARRAVERGHAVRVLGDPSMGEDVKAIGATFIPFVRAPHRINRTAEADFARTKEPDRIGVVSLQRDRQMYGPARAYGEDLLAELEREPADVLAIDESLLGAQAVAERERIPTAVLIPHCFSLPAPGRPAPGLGFLPARGPLGRVRDAIVWKVVERLYGSGLPALNSARAQLGLGPLTGAFEQIMRMDRLLLLSSRAFDYPVGVLPAHARYVGPALNDPPWVGSWELPWPEDHPDPLVLIGLSTVFRGQPARLQALIDAVEGLRVRVLVALGPVFDVEQFRAPANVVIRKSVPYTRVFPHTSAVVSNGGHGTVIKALAYGVPVVCIPQDQDQPDNAARVVAAGAGLHISSRARPAVLRAAIRRVVEEPHFRENARRVAAGIAEEQRDEHAVEELEELAGRARAVGAPAL